jgi:hypothetical protein
MSDTEMPRDGEESDRPVAADEAAEDEGLVIIPGEPGESDGEGLVIIPGAGVPDESDEEELLQPGDDEPVASDEPGAAEEPAADPGDEEAPGEPHFTLDELVAEMADVSTVVTDGSTPEPAAPEVPKRVDVLADAMSDTFAEAPPIEAALWTRIPFWVLGAVWALSVGVLTYLLWPGAKAGLAGTQLYNILVFGGAALVVAGAVVGAVIWSRARSQADMADRKIVSRTMLLRALVWAAMGVALWVVSMIVLSLHSLDVIP